MATNKNALIRYRVLDGCFRNHGRRYFIDDLIAECEKVLLEMDSASNGISRRQIFDDIAFMESKEGWQIELEKLRYGKKVFYRYLAPSFSINNMPLNQIEIEQLHNAVDILSQFKGMPQFEWINELLPKLKQGITINNDTEIIIDFDNNQYLIGIEHLGPLYSAILYKKVLTISYQPFENATPFDVTLHPYHLKQYNNRWFLFGYNPEKNKYNWNLALDRIVNITETNTLFKKNNQINWKEYFEDMIGVTKPEGKKPETVTLLFYGTTGKYIESKPLHGSQKKKWLDTNTLEIKLSVILNYELERLIMSYGESVKVIGPLHLCEIIPGRHKKAFDLYNT
jgi:predicted DNA-binding transcriptional regulator YafY